MRRALDVRFHDRGREHRLYVDLVADTRYTQEIAHADSGVLSLELILDIARQRQPATFDHHLDGVCRQGTGPAQQVLGRLRDVGILDLYRQRLHASDALGGSFGIEFLVLAADLTGQRHDVILHFDTDLRGVHGGLPLQFCHHVPLQLRIGLHGVGSIGVRRIEHHLGVRAGLCAGTPRVLLLVTGWLACVRCLTDCPSGRFYKRRPHSHRELDGTQLQGSEP